MGMLPGQAHRSHRTRRRTLIKGDSQSYCSFVTCYDVTFCVRHVMSDTDPAQLKALYLARAAEFRELSRTATDPVLTSAYAQIAENYEELAKLIAENEC
jgi:hypothetical protein